MSTIDLNSLSADDLKQLMANAERMLRDRHQQRIHSLRKEAEELAASLNMSVAELFGLDKTSKLANKKLPAKYVNSADPSQTWSGRGKRPHWLADALARGESLERFAV
ncbi:MAG: H-NS histone family protein [Halothiobacillus sp.]